MNASYEVRLWLQCLNSFFAAYLVLSIALHFVAPMAVWCAERIRPALGTRLLLAFRILPLAAGLYAAVALALPSYLRLEPETESERIGFWALCVAALALGCWIRPFGRTIRAVWRSSKFLKHARRMARRSRIASGDVWLLSERRPHIAVAGLLRPRVFLSNSALELLSPEELEVVLQHESAHQQSRDNLKRLLLLALPDALPSINFMASLERALKRLVEWSADDYAAAGDRKKSIALARALVCFARHRGASCVLATSLVDDSSELARRVERLLGRSQPTQPNPRARLAPAMLAIVMLATALRFIDLPNAHRLLELLSR